MGKVSEDTIRRVVQAITDAGDHPQYHYEVKARHRGEWRQLWKALDRLVIEYYDQG